MKRAIFTLGLLSLGVLQAAEHPVFVCYHGEYNEVSYSVYAEHPLFNTHQKVTLIKRIGVPGFDFARVTLFPQVMTTTNVWNGMTEVAFLNSKGEPRRLRFVEQGRSILLDDQSEILELKCRAVRPLEPQEIPDRD